ncbi:JmjC domain-containing protein [Paraburkholderia bannensis]|uniref:JmjC domain-containing protein n=1 Tax=Paraburkholderia bannensis TaxID=765414 RepID=UPI002AB1AAD9|nr:cupin domain-containing protein [Paraburkholderia bannensis]
MDFSTIRHSPIGLNQIISNELIREFMHAEPGSKVYFLGPIVLPCIPSIQLTARDLNSFFTRHAKSGERVRIYRHGTAIDVASFGNFSEHEDILGVTSSLNATIYLSGLHIDIPYLAELAACFAIGLRSSISVNAFVSPANASSTPVHYDYENLIVYQIFGRKSWKFYEHPDRPTFTADGYKIDHERLGRAYLHNELKQHDAVFIPKGAIHQAETSNSASIHLVFNLSPLRDEDLFLALCARAWRKGADVEPSFPNKVAGACARLDQMTDRTAALEELTRNQLFSAVAKYQRPTECPDFTGDTRFIASAGCIYRRWIMGGRLQIEYASPIPLLTQIDLAGYAPARLEAPVGLVPIFEVLERGKVFCLGDLRAVLDEPSIKVAFRLMLKLGFISIV